MAAQKVVCFDHVTNLSGGGERAGPRNHGNSLRLQWNSGRSKMADRMLYLAFSFKDLLLNGNF